MLTFTIFGYFTYPEKAQSQCIQISKDLLYITMGRSVYYIYVQQQKVHTLIMRRNSSGLTVRNVAYARHHSYVAYQL